MLKKEMIYKLIITILVIAILTLITLKFTSNKNNVNNNNNEVNDTIKNSIEGAWSKVSTEYYRDNKFDFSIDEITGTNMYMIISEEKISFCNVDTEESSCDTYAYKVNNDNIIVYNLNDIDETKYIYEVTENEIILTYNSNDFTTKNYYEKILN